MQTHSDSFVGSVVTYLIAGVAYVVEKFGYLFEQLGDVNWLNVGAAVLLIARLAQDVPKAYFYLRDIMRGTNDKSE